MPRVYRKGMALGSQSLILSIHTTSVTKKKNTMA